MKVDSLYICPWSLQDSLCQSQSLSYLKGLTACGYKFALMTFENPLYKLEAANEKRIKIDLAARGIFWYPVRYRQGTSVLNKFYENLSGITAGIAAVRRHRPQIVHSRSSLPVAIALTLSKIFRLKFLYDADSVLSEEYVESGHWTREGKSYKLTSRFENLGRRRAREMIVLTETLREDLRRDCGVKIPIEVIPCCVDTETFRFGAESRDARRRELGLTDEKLLIYVGKVGSWYLVEETFDFFKVFNRKFPASRLLIVSRDDQEAFRRLAEERKIPENLFFVRSAEHREVKEWLSASDAGLSLIRQLKSKRGSSPVKFGEYLSTGLPVVTTDEIGDCSRLVKDENVGVVLERTDEESYDKASEQLMKLLDGSGVGETSARCRKIAEMNFSLESVGVERYRKIYERLTNTAVQQDRNF